MSENILWMVSWNSRAKKTGKMQTLQIQLEILCLIWSNSFCPNLGLLDFETFLGNILRNSFAISSRLVLFFEFTADKNVFRVENALINHIIRKFQVYINQIFWNEIVWFFLVFLFFLNVETYGEFNKIDLYTFRVFCQQIMWVFMFTTIMIFVFISKFCIDSNHTPTFICYEIGPRLLGFLRNVSMVSTKCG